jgi:outer membrane biosynthesis protein TonB
VTAWLRFGAAFVALSLLAGCQMMQTQLSAFGSAAFWSGSAAFKAYHAQCIKLVEARWNLLLKPIPREQYQKGKVVIRFKLHDDGSITDLKILKNTSNELLASLCEHAVLDCVPFDHWTPKMEKIHKGLYFKGTFTFHYQ